MAPASRKSPPHPFELLDGARDRQREAMPELNAAASSYVAHLSALGQLLEIYLHRLLKPHRLSYSDFRVLSTLRLRSREYRATPHDLNEVAQLTSAGITRTLDRLQSAGWVDRVPNPDDRRSVLVGLTDEGWDYAASLMRSLSDEHQRLLGDLSTPGCQVEIETLRDIIARLADAIPEIK